MPSKTSRTTRKYGTVTRIKLYADEKARVKRINADFGELCWQTHDEEDRELIRDSLAGLNRLVVKYTDYQDNGQASLDFDESPESSETTDAASSESSQ